MVAMEKAGIPAVAIAAQSFARAWQSCVDGWGQPTTAYVIIPHATTGQQTDFIRNMVDGQIDAIIQGLTTFRRPEGQSPLKRPAAPPRSSPWRWTHPRMGWTR